MEQERDKAQFPILREKRTAFPSFVQLSVTTERLKSNEKHLTRRIAVPTALTKADRKIQWKPPTVPHPTHKLSGGKVEEPQVVFPTEVCSLNPSSEIKGGGSSRVLLQMRGTTCSKADTATTVAYAVTWVPQERPLIEVLLKNGCSNNTLNSHEPRSSEPHDWCIKGTEAWPVTGLRKAGQQPWVSLSRGVMVMWALY